MQTRRLAAFSLVLVSASPAMLVTSRFLVCGVALLSLRVATPAAAQAGDVAGSRDHPLVPRFQGAAASGSH